MKRIFTGVILQFLLIAISHLSLFAQQQTEELVAKYTFTGNANDESGNGFNGTVNGATLTSGKDNLPNSAYAPLSVELGSAVLIIQ